MPIENLMRFALSVALSTDPGPSEPVRAELVVDAEALGDPAPAIERQLKSRGEQALRDAEVLPATSPDDPRIEVAVEPLPDDAGFRCKLRVVQGDQVVEGTSATTECRLCTDDELAKQVGEAIARVAARIEPEPADEPAPVAADTVPPPVVAVSPNGDGAWRLEKLGKAGIGLAVSGGTAFGLGMGFAVAPLLVRESNARSGQSVGLAGTAVAIVGGAALVSGIVLILVDRQRSLATPTSARVRKRRALVGLRPQSALAWTH